MSITSIIGTPMNRVLGLGSLIPGTARPRNVTELNLAAAAQASRKELKPIAPDPKPEPVFLLWSSSGWWTPLDGELLKLSNHLDADAAQQVHKIRMFRTLIVDAQDEGKSQNALYSNQWKLNKGDAQAILNFFSHLSGKIGRSTLFLCGGCQWQGMLEEFVLGLCKVQTGIHLF